MCRNLTDMDVVLRKWAAATMVMVVDSKLETADCVHGIDYYFVDQTFFFGIFLFWCNFLFIELLLSFGHSFPNACFRVSTSHWKQKKKLDLYSGRFICPINLREFAWNQKNVERFVYLSHCFSWLLRCQIF